MVRQRRCFPTCVIRISSLFQISPDPLQTSLFSGFFREKERPRNAVENAACSCVRMPFSHWFKLWSKPCAFGMASLGVHGALALAWPELPLEERADAETAQLVWLTQDGSGGDLAGGLGERVSPPPASPAEPARAPRRRERAARAEPVPAEVVRDEAREAASTSTDGQGAPAELAASSALVGEASDGAGTGNAGGAMGAEAGVAGTKGAASDGTGAGGAAAHGPGLIARGSPCFRFFPAQARVLAGEVQIEVNVDAAGHSHASRILVESPRGQGFASAASACARQLTFAPAADAAGLPVAGRAKLLLKFRRG
jgi:hypothetical protein